MNRRHFLHRAAAFVSCTSVRPLLAAGNEPQIAFTFDDPTTETRGNLD